jgi:hypothetical protein
MISGDTNEEDEPINQIGRAFCAIVVCTVLLFAEGDSMTRSARAENLPHAVRVVKVTTRGELREALEAARPGDQIVLENTVRASSRQAVKVSLMSRL